MNKLLSNGPFRVNEIIQKIKHHSDLKKRMAANKKGEGALPSIGGHEESDKVREQSRGG